MECRRIVTKKDSRYRYRYHRVALVQKDVADLPGADIYNTSGKSACHPADLSNPEVDAHGTDQLSQDPHMGVVQITAHNLGPASSVTLTCSL